MILGILFLLVGISILLKAFFHINIPVFRTGVALFIIYIGIKMLVGGGGSREGGHHDWDWESDDATVFNSRDFKWSAADSGHRHYAVVFGSSTVDLTGISADKPESAMAQINVVFGEATVLVSRKTPLRLKVNSVFGEGRTPNDNVVAFGTLRYEQPELKSADTPHVKIQGNVVFGSLKFVAKD